MTSAEDIYSLARSKIRLLTIALVPGRVLALPQQQFHHKQRRSVGLQPLLELAPGQVVVEGAAAEVEVEVQTRVRM
jgi:hypothetical protein